MKRVLSCLAALSALAAPALAAERTINTGYWEAQTVWLGVPGATDRWCIQPKDIAKFLSGPSNHIYRCTYPTSVAADGQLEFDGVCRDKNGLEIKLRGRGAYTPTTMHMTASGKTKLFGLPITGDASVDAHFVSAACPPDAKAFSG